jgi:aconitate hydratase
MFKKRYANVFEGPKEWQEIKATGGTTYKWDPGSTYVQNPPYFVDMKNEPEALHDIKGARLLALFGDSITTDHISPAGSIKKDGPAGNYLLEHQVRPADFNSYGARRGNHEVMMRGTFANIRIKNEMLGGKEGGLTKTAAGETVPIYDAAMKYIASNTPLIVVAGKEYGTGSSRDWAAKGTNLLGVKAVIAESFERIHRSNLVGMGVLPLQFKDGMTRETLKLVGDESFDIAGITSLKPRMDIKVLITRPSFAGDKNSPQSGGVREEITCLCRIDTLDEIEYFKNGGILHYVLRSIAKSAKKAA